MASQKIGIGDLSIEGGLERALLKFPDIDLTRVRLVGWGAGEMFELYYPLLKLPLEYIVCPWEINHGRIIHDLQVHSPNILQAEDEHTILIIIFAGHWPEILRQIRVLGKFKAICAVSRNTTKSVLAELSRIKLAKDYIITVEKPSPANYGIVMQGPIYPYWTRAAISWNRIQHPNAHIVVSTWVNQSDHLIQEIETLADDVVTSISPDIMGSCNRNAQIRSSKAGLVRLAERNVPKAIKTRTDQLLTGQKPSRLFELAGPVASSTLHESHRIGIHFGSTWKYVPFHFSDQLIAGRTADLLMLWSCPEDQRTVINVLETDVNHFSALRDVSSESYLYGNYAQTLGRPSATLRDSAAFARDHIFPLDSYLGQFSLKGIALFDVIGHYPEEAFLNQEKEPLVPDFEWWARLLTNFSAAEKDAELIEQTQFTVDDFWKLRVKI